MIRGVGLRSLVVVAVCAAVAACSGSSGSGTTKAGPTTSGSPTATASATSTPARPEPAFAVVAGADGVAIVDGGELEKVDGVPENVYAYNGPLAVPLPDGRSAAIVAGDHVVVAGPGRAALVADCEECSGVALDGDTIVTTRANHSAGEGFDIVRFGLDLSPKPVVKAKRLEEKARSDIAENTESPITLAASGGGVVVAYLSRNGGLRKGPYVVASYTAQGELVANSSVSGVIGQTAVSPDGRYVAMGVGGTSGACATEYDLNLLEVSSLRPAEVQPKVPAEAVNGAAGVDPWFELTDLAWAGSTVTATGFVHAPAADDTSNGCDSPPTTWRRTVDPAAGAPEDRKAQVSYAAQRWIGPDCRDAVEILRNLQGGGDLTMEKSGELLGNYDRLRFGRPSPTTCPA